MNGWSIVRMANIPDHFCSSLSSTVRQTSISLQYVILDVDNDALFSIYWCVLYFSLVETISVWSLLLCLLTCDIFICQKSWPHHDRRCVYWFITVGIFLRSCRETTLEYLIHFLKDIAIFWVSQKTSSIIEHFNYDWFFFLLLICSQWEKKSNYRNVHRLDWINVSFLWHKSG